MSAIQGMLESWGFLKLFMGPMYSQKTTNLVNAVTLYADIDMKCLMINHSDDNRVEEGLTHGDKNLSTHNSSYHGLSEKIDCLKVGFLSQVNVNPYQVIGIDEGQFYPDLFATVEEWLHKLGKIIICAGLSGSSSLRPIGQVLDLIPLADEVVHLRATCKFCLQERKRLQSAFCSLRLNGGSEEFNTKARYEASCRYHYLLHNTL